MTILLCRKHIVDPSRIGYDAAWTILLRALCLTLFLSPLGCDTSSQATRHVEGANAVQQALRAAYRASRGDQAPLERIEIHSVPGHPNTFVAICDWTPQWWGSFCCFAFENGQITWIADMDVVPTEQSIYKIRGIQLEGFDAAIIEVYGMTHMGNGSIYLYELRNNTLRNLLHAYAVDWHDDGRLFRDGTLTPQYVDLNGDGMIDVELTGIVDETGDQSDDIIASHPCRRAFHWDADTQQFIEDVSQRIGLEQYVQVQ